MERQQGEAKLSQAPPGPWLSNRPRTGCRNPSPLEAPRCPNFRPAADNDTWSGRANKPSGKRTIVEELGLATLCHAPVRIQGPIRLGGALAQRQRCRRRLHASHAPVAISVARAAEAVAILGGGAAQALALARNVRAKPRAEAVAVLGGGSALALGVALGVALKLRDETALARATARAPLPQAAPAEGGLS
eukprot:CAMPEP_0204018820 /NCGR_PEP_ID=MMETSP0360-20130528/28345_1 /ASSEMBLY_ACC=CAM_ASM_000342 /TAXON_ID=268821 /ORGANISM="Scrippsiella Hangoei, Strain SHTV-5" /LENGTH=190 /DNA_ID=CAMNT_0050961997 /DNA_START=173 /DNA_END=744 /DNA_ORIENTATION=-